MILRQTNYLGQMRWDVPHLRAVESSAAADFDLLAGAIMAGKKPLVVKGLEVLMSGAIGAPAENLLLEVADAVLMNPLASESGTIFMVMPDAAAEVLNSTNAKVNGAFSAGQVNYVGLDLRREADDSTADLVAFMDANTKLEATKSVPLGRTMQYRIVISTVDFESQPYLLPIAKVTTNASNLVTAIADARPMAWRLGLGGSSPDRYAGYSWGDGRSEDVVTNVFSGGDKQIGSLKDWVDAVMTRLWELGGGEYWYTPTSDRELKLICGTSVITSTSDNFKWTLGTNTLEWKGLSIAFGNSATAYNTVSDGSSTILDNQCLYVDINRATTGPVVPQVASLTTLGQSNVPGQRFVIAWRRGNSIFIKDRPYEVGRALAVATDTVFGVVKLKTAAVDPTNPTVLAMQANGSFVNVATGGNTAAYVGTGSGSGAGFFGTGGSGGGPGVSGKGGASGGPGLRGEPGAGSTIGVQSTADMSVPNTNNYKFDTVRTFKKTFTGLENMAVVVVGAFTPFQNGPAGGGSYTETGKPASASGDKFAVRGSFGLPVGAIITAVTAALRSSGGNATADLYLKKYQYTPAGLGSFTPTVSNCLSTSAVFSGFIGGGDFLGAPSLAAVGNRTVSSNDEIFGWEFVYTSTSAGDSGSFVALEVTYTLPALLPDNG